jgi:outer membrane protein TolC
MRPIIAVLILLLPGTLWGQDSISLTGCHMLAIQNAPRLQDKSHLEQIGVLKSDNAGTLWYPSLNLNGKVSYQSDVIELVLEDVPFPIEFPEIPHDQYGLDLDVSQTLYDGGITKSRRRFEEATTAAELQSVEVDLYSVKSRINQIYFTILLLQENNNNLQLHREILLKRKAVLESAMEEGAVMESEIKVLEVELLKIQQSLIQIESGKQSMLNTLNVLCGTQFPDDVHLTLPHFEQPVEDSWNRPEELLFKLKDASMEAGKELLARKRMPHLFAFGQAGYGKPGYNFLGGEWDFYYRVGAGLRWNIWDWNTNRRERQVIEQQQHILQNRKAAFDMGISTKLVQEEKKIEQYKKSVELERQVLDLQEEISEQASVKLANGTITATDYITEINKESMARINMATHKIRILQSMANYLILQGNL